MTVFVTLRFVEVCCLLLFCITFLFLMATSPVVGQAVSTGPRVIHSATLVRILRICIVSSNHHYRLQSFHICPPSEILAQSLDGRPAGPFRSTGSTRIALPRSMKFCHLFSKSNACDISAALINAKASLIRLDFWNQEFHLRTQIDRVYKTKFSRKCIFNDVCSKARKATAVFCGNSDFSYDQAHVSKQKQARYKRREDFASDTYPHLHRRSAVTSVVLGLIAAFVGAINPPPSNAVLKTVPTRQERSFSYLFGAEQYIYRTHTIDLFKEVSRSWRPENDSLAHSRSYD
jgi:hypothetical protein